MMSQDNTDRDTTIADIHKIREEISERFGGEIRAITEDARKRQEASGRPTWKGSAGAHQPGPSAPDIDSAAD